MQILKPHQLLLQKSLKVLSIDFPKNSCLNINIPKLSFDDIKGIKICKQPKAFGMIDLRKNEINSEMIIIG